MNNDLIYNAYFNLDDLQKNSFEVSHPDGKIEVKFPTEFNTQVPLRIRNKGFKSNQIGDMFIKMNVKYSRS
jgi:DnaJ-class molecular chaperone